MNYTGKLHENNLMNNYTGETYENKLTNNCNTKLQVDFEVQWYSKREKK